MSREPLGQLGHAPGIDPPLERTAERDADRHRGRPVGCGEDPLDPLDRLREGRVPVVPVEPLGRAECDVEAVEPRGREALVALLVEHEPGVLGLFAPLDRGDHLLRAGHLRHAVVPDEADRLDPRQPRGGKPVDEVGANRGLERLGLVLKAVTRPDVAEREHQSRPCDSTRSARIRAVILVSPGTWE